MAPGLLTWRCAAMQLAFVERRLRAAVNMATIRNPLAVAEAAVGERDVGDREECVSFLLEQLVRLSQTYDARLDKRGPDFAGYASNILPRRIVDWTRATRGRQTWAFAAHVHERRTELPVVLSLDATIAGGPELVDSLAGSALDPALDCSPDVAWALRDRDRRARRPIEASRSGAPRPAGGRADRELAGVAA